MPDSDDGGAQASVGARGIILLAVAVVLGAVLLQAFDRGAVPFADVSTDTRPATTTTVDEGSGGGGNGEDPTTTTTSPALEPAEVTVVAANGTEVSGLATRVTDFLAGVGYADTLTPTDVINKPIEESRVEHRAGFAREAAAVAQALDLPSNSLAEVEEFEPVGIGTEGAEILVVIGPDLDRPLA